MGDRALFLGKFLRHGTAIASLAPSSRWLSRATVAQIDWDRTEVLVELGAGTGPITREIVARARPQSRVLVFERDADFASLLRERFSHLAHVEVIEADVGNLGPSLADRGVGRVDEIVSGLPVPSFPRALQVNLFRTVRDVLRPDGGFHQITELPWVYWRFYRRYFDAVRFRFEPRNIPPAGVYYCRNVKDVV
ncbi:MAG: methyltransferase domain-containing protein [Isosphaeraceae bacterium]